MPWPDPPLRSDEVLLRPWSSDDLPVLVTLGQGLTIARWFPVIPCPYTERDAIDWLESEETGRQSGKGIAFAIAHAGSGEVLGGISLGNVDALLRTASIGYWLGAHARGRGYMAPAVRLVAGWAIETLDLARLEGTVDPENIASQRIAERCGSDVRGVCAPARSSARPESAGTRSSTACCRASSPRRTPQRGAAPRGKIHRASVFPCNTRESRSTW